ncbi:MAG: helix-turn-helix domain-containing protein [Verrucomicrobiaceae bacterium]|nr:helix-turn-helix domain-containing protein [Verrucomicrobiaceae bacterium]
MNQTFKHPKEIKTGVKYETKLETARRLRVSIRTIENWVQSGRLPMAKIGRRCLFDPEAVDQAIQGWTLNLVTATQRSSDLLHGGAR